MNPQRENSGILFKNDRKASEQHPDYKGNATIGGEEFYLSAWLKQGRNGKFLSLSFTAKSDQREGARADDDRLRPPQDADIDASFAAVDDAALRRQASQSFADASKRR